MALHGDLETFPLPDVLRLLASTSKSGRLDVTGTDEHGEVWFAEGGITGGRVSSALNATAPAEVVYELQRFENGAFEFDASAEVQVDDPREAVDVVLEDAEAMLQLWRDVSAVVPSVDVWVTLVAELDGDEVVIAADQWRTVAGLRGGMSVRQLADRFALTDLAACQAVKALVDLGLVAVGAELARPAEPTFVPHAVADRDQIVDEGAEARGSDGAEGIGEEVAAVAHDEPEAGHDADAARSAHDEHDEQDEDDGTDGQAGVDESVAHGGHATTEHGTSDDAVGSAIEAAVAAAFEASDEAGDQADHEAVPTAELPDELPDQDPLDAPVSARERLDAMAATYLAAGAVVIEADDEALLPEPLPGVGTSFESFDGAEAFGEIHAFGRHEIDHHRPQPLAGPIPPPVAVPTVRDHLAPSDAPAPDDEGSGPEGGFGWRPERRAKRPDAVQSALANLSPAAAQAIAEVADKSGQGVKPGTADADGDAVDRGTLLRFLSSVKN